MCAKTGSLLSILVIVILQLCDDANHVESQICTRIISYWDEVLETYWRTYWYTIKNPDCWVFCGTVRRVGSYESTHYVNKLLTKTKSECCPGYYKQAETYYSLICQPICSKPCGNGICEAPEKCRCYRGYTFANSTCQPVCMDVLMEVVVVLRLVCVTQGGKWYNLTPRIQSYWMYILGAVGVLVVLLLLIIIIVRRSKRNQSLDSNSVVQVPVQDVTPKVFNKSKHSYDMCNTNSEL
ncbi:hypothetical protein PYW08_001837 [Mythimna loreyi]|uniref:Uncharacterized protein n=1 Tax=Mythimna loreyi TaxID=667449 RepID=A0ACC2R7N6_9NEOP|nr:hypothetical protein PYW08_001837 [Mythimna loreyi]